MEAKIGSQFPPILPPSRSHVLPRDMARPATMFGIVWAGLFNSSLIINGCMRASSSPFKVDFRDDA